MSVALISGCSSGVGLRLAVSLAKTHKVYATMRNLEKRGPLDEAIKEAGVSEKVIILQMDVCDEESVNKCVKTVVDTEKRLDVLVNNAGYSVFGTVEMLEMQTVMNQFNTNLYGVIRTQKAVLPTMREQKSGKIINVSSIGGVYGQPFNDVYCASKFALEGLAESQAALFQTFGVYVTNVQPGAIKTSFIANAKMPENVPEEYKVPLGQVTAAFKASGSNPKSAQEPQDVAQYIIDHVVQVEKPPLRVQPNDFTKPVFDALVRDPTGQTSVNITNKRFLGKE